MRIVIEVFIGLLIAGFIAFILVVLISAVENKKLTIQSFEIKSSKLPDNIDELKLVVLADLHDACYGENNEKLLFRINELSPDLIIISGDMIIGKKNYNSKNAINLINELCKTYKVYMGFGNHEMRVSLYDKYGDVWDTFLKSVDNRLVLLDNDYITYVEDNNSINIWGLNINPDYYKRFIIPPMDNDYLNHTLGDIDINNYNILIAHNPNYFENYVTWGADLILSGHIHGGMIRLPILGGMLSPMIRFFPKYDKGLYEKDGKCMVLSGGLGNHTYKFRVNNIPEVNYIVIKRNTNEEL